MNDEPLLPQWTHVVFYTSMFATIGMVFVLIGRDAFRPVEVEQRIVASLNVIDRCEACHDMADHPADTLDKHPVERFGCTVCHGGQGAALTAEAAHLASPAWERPLFTSAEREAACGTCHQGTTVAGAPRLSRGRVVLADRGCVGCHEIPGVELPEIAPDLNGLKDKVSASWVRAWLADPGTLNIDHRMPQFAMPDTEMDTIVAFLFSLEGPALAAVAPPAASEAVDEAAPDSARGRKAIAYRRCATCHRIEGRGGGFAPDLSLAGAKLNATWMFNLLTDTHRLRPHTRMPGFQLPAAEAADIVAYASEQWVPDTAEPAWTTFSNEVKRELVDVGRFEFIEHGCPGCHRAGDVPRAAAAMPLDNLGRRRVGDMPLADGAAMPDLPTWIATKVRVPAAFDLPGATPSLMPAYRGLSPDDALAVGIALASLRSDPLPGDYVIPEVPATVSVPAGQLGAIVDRYRCLECHELGGRGGHIAGVALDGEGSRVQRPWLLQFLREPVTIRMDQGARMPVLGLSEADAGLLADWILSSLADPLIPEGAVLGDPVAGAAAYASRGCAACHMSTGEGTMKGPVLDGAGARLDPDYVVSMLREGAAVVPGGRHPADRLTDGEARDIAAWIAGL